MLRSRDREEIITYLEAQSDQSANRILKPTLQRC
jgi:hypothetical protein